MALIRYSFWHRLHVPEAAATAASQVHTQSSMSSPSQNRTVSRHRERGAELLEFAFVLSALMILLLGIVDFGRAYNIYQTITRAAREGAREAVLPSSMYDGGNYIDPNSTYTNPKSSTIFQNYIAPALSASSLDPNAVQNYVEQVAWIDPNDSDKQCGVTITFSYPFQLQIPFTRLTLATPYLTTSVQMRMENANYQPDPDGDGTLVQTCP